MADLAKLQTELGIRGSLGEIGVHMGKSFIVLKLNASQGEKCFAIDVFSDQHLNVDYSGYGDREIFSANVERWTGDCDVHIIQKSSLSVRPADILKQCGPVRLMSIDGGHSEECTYNDLRLAERVLTDSGVAIIDDYFNESWPGVASGVARYLYRWGSKLKPFMFSPNKIYFARAGFHAMYRDKMRARHNGALYKQSKMFGYEIDIFHPH